MIELFVAIAFISLAWLVAGIGGGLGYTTSAAWVGVSWVGLPIALMNESLAMGKYFIFLMFMWLLITGDFEVALLAGRNIFMVFLGLRATYYICYQIPIQGVAQVKEELDSEST